MANQKAMTALAVAAGILLLAGLIWLMAPLLDGPKTPQVRRAAPGESSRAPARAPDDPARPAVEYADGTRAQLAGIRFLGDEPPIWWGADGTSVSPGEHEFSYLSSVGGWESDPNRRAIEVRVAIDTSDPRQKSYSVRVGDRSANASHYIWDGPTGVMFSCVNMLPRVQETAELDFGLAAGPWQDRDVVAIADAPGRSAQALPFRAQRPTGASPSTAPVEKTPFRILAISEQDGQTLVEYTDIRHWTETAEMQWQAVLRDKSGRDRHYKTVRYPEGRMIFVYDIPLDQAEAAVYQVRPWEWKRLGTIRLQPAAQPITP